MDKTKPSAAVFLNEDGVLTKILSKLSLKDAVKTSVLSRRWRYIWTYLPNIHVFFPSHHNFSAVKIFRIDREHLNDLIPKLTDETVQIMDIVLKQHCGSGVETFRVAMPFYEKHARSLDQWVAFAAAANTKELLMALYPMGNKCYDFPFHMLFQQNRQSAIKSLHLQSCSLQVPAGIGCLRSLQTLKIYYVRISDVDFKNLVSTCAVMEELHVSFCHDLENMSIHQQSGRLKHLTVHHCYSLMSIDVQAKKLVGFWYRGNLINFSFQYVSCITEGELCFQSDACVLNFVLMKLPKILPQFQKLKLVFIYLPELTHMPEMSCHRFEHVKHLAVSVNFVNGGNILLLIALLTLAPRLEKLTFRLPLIAPGMCMEVPIHNIPLAHLKEVEIIGFIGSEGQIKFLQYLFNNASTLRSMKIGVLLLVTKYFQDGSQWFLHSRDGTTSDYIKSLAPPDLNIDISYITSQYLLNKVLSF